MLLATGPPPVTATVSNALGVIPGSISGAIGYRRELSGQRRRLLTLATGAALGALTGATLPSSNYSGDDVMAGEISFRKGNVRYGG